MITYFKTRNEKRLTKSFQVEKSPAATEVPAETKSRWKGKENALEAGLQPPHTKIPFSVKIP